MKRRAFLAATALVLPAASALPALPPDDPAPAPRPVTWPVLTRYYAFLRKEMMLLSKEMGVAPNDPWIVDVNGDREAMEWLSGDTPSSRAHAILDVISAPLSVPLPDRGDMLLPLLRAALEDENDGPPALPREEQINRRLALECWSGPAPTRESALLAQEFANRDSARVSDSAAAKSMRSASDKYFRWCNDHG